MRDYSIKSIRQDFKSKGIFYTQPELALFLKSFLPDDVDEVYDPTCGCGNLLSVFDDSVKKYGQDINGDQVEEARSHLQNFTGAVGDTLTTPAFIDRRFRYIIANPPFSIKWDRNAVMNGVGRAIFDDWPMYKGKLALPPESKADYAFIAHIIHLLSDDGTAVALNFPGILYRGNSEGVIRQWLVEKNYVDTVVQVDGGKFIDTTIATVVLVLKKNKSTTDVRFVHNDKEIVVPVSEIANNSYNLSVSQYVVEEQLKEEIDMIALEAQAREAFYKRLRNELNFDRFVCQMEGFSFTEFTSEIRHILDELEGANDDGHSEPSSTLQRGQH